MSKRYNIDKRKSTKSERLFYEVLKEMKVSFKHRWIIEGREVDFVIGQYAIEISGHKQDTYKNEFLVKNNYIPIHLENNEVTKENIKKLINKL